jgi:hypothetical protein
MYQYHKLLAAERENAMMERAVTPDTVDDQY